ncbi:hypothetical protein L7F22_035328 [Adiantum nelumboides]|nr:hypothetical protein [Adiantum nelumboides]
MTKYGQAFLAAIESSSSSAVQDEQQVVQVCSLKMYDVIKAFEAKDSVNAINGKHEARVDTKYKSVAKKVKPVALPLPTDCREKMEQASLQPSLRDQEKVGHRFTKDSLKELKIGCGEFLKQSEQRCFEKMLSKHGKAFAFEPHEIGCVDPSVVAPMVIFTLPHIPWNLRSVPVPKALLPKLIELLNEKIRMGILEPSCAPYSNRWFTVPKKNGTLRFIQDMQPVNKVTIRNVGTGPIVDEFAGRAIYSMGDLYLGMINSN